VPDAVLVTGGAGFIGSNLADALVAEGARVHVVDDLSMGREHQVPGAAELHVLDIRDVAALEGVVAAARPRTIFHLAAQADVRRALAEPTFDADVNVLGTISVLEAARRVGARVVFASTGGAGYGEYPGLAIPSPETAETRPLSHYGMSKMAGEGFCGRLLDSERPRVFGDGRQTRDYVYVGDVCSAFLAAAAGAAGEIVNIGCGQEVSVLDLLEGLGYRDEPEFAPARPGELGRSALDPGKAGELWGWRPRTGLAEGLALTFDAVRAARADPAARPPGAFG
jgi:UDP-glucose 4-epimerase